MALSGTDCDGPHPRHVVLYETAVFGVFGLFLVYLGGRLVLCIFVYLAPYFAYSAFLVGDRLVTSLGRAEGTAVSLSVNEREHGI